MIYYPPWSQAWWHTPTIGSWSRRIANYRSSVGYIDRPCLKTTVSNYKGRDYNATRKRGQWNGSDRTGDSLEEWRPRGGAKRAEESHKSCWAFPGLDQRLIRNGSLLKALAQFYTSVHSGHPSWQLSLVRSLTDWQTQTPAVVEWQEVNHSNNSQQVWLHLCLNLPFHPHFASLSAITFEFTEWRVALHITSTCGSHIRSDIYIIIHNSRKITVRN